MDAGLADASTKEDKAIKIFDGMTAAKAKEIQALTGEIESKTVCHGEAKMELFNVKADLSDTQEQPLEDKNSWKNSTKVVPASALWQRSVQT